MFTSSTYGSFCQNKAITTLYFLKACFGLQKIALVDGERGIKKQTYWDFFETVFNLKQNVERNYLLCILVWKKSSHLNVINIRILPLEYLSIIFEFCQIQNPVWIWMSQKTNSEHGKGIEGGIFVSENCKRDISVHNTERLRP